MASGLPMRASYPNGDTSAPVRESADHRRGRAGFAHPQACDERADQGAGQGASAAQSTAAPSMLVWATASRPRLDYAGQGEQDGRQNQTQAHGDSLGNLVRLEFRPLCRDPHVARCTPVPGARRALLDLDLKGTCPDCATIPAWSRRAGLTSRAGAGPYFSGAISRRAVASRSKPCLFA